MSQERMRHESEGQKPSDLGAFIGAGQEQLPIIGSARTGLAGKDDAVTKRVPVEYSGKTVQDVLTYIVQNAQGNETALAQSVTKELRASGCVVVVNGKKAELSDKADKYLVVKEHELPDKTKRRYQELEIEVSAVQRGGYIFR